MGHYKAKTAKSGSTTPLDRIDVADRDARSPHA
jgi:hypothetical protein